MNSSEKRIDFNSIIGLDEVKNKLKEYILLPVQYPILYQGKRYPQKWPLLYGPPGNGKSYLSKAVESELNLIKKNSFFSITLDKFINKSLEERIKILNELFQEARNNKPSAVFIEDMDLILNYKKEENEDLRKFEEEFFTNITPAGTNKDNTDIVIFGATNKPWDIAPFIQRRFTRFLYVDLPDANERKLLFKFFIGNNNNITEEKFENICNLTKGYSRKDIHDIIQGIINSKISCITFEDLSKSIEKIKPLDNKENCEKMDNFRKKFNII